MPPVSSRAPATTIIILAAIMAAGCTSLRIAYHREPMPAKSSQIFAQRTVARAQAPFAFARQTALRTDLDTLSVRDVDGSMQPFASYLQRRRIRGFLVVRHDTILYEHYAAPLSETTLWNAYSATKSVTSILLGIALARGEIRSLDDSVTRYVPEAATRETFRGITLRHLLGMQSGFAYSRTNGSPWHDLRSSDAHFFFTHDRTKLLLNQRRQDPPGTRWSYKDSDPDLVALVLTRATGKTLAQQLEERVWSRIGTEHDASFNVDRRDGLEDAGAGLNAVARGYARVGRLMLHYGRWDNATVLDSGWVAATTALDTIRTEPEVVTWYRMQHTGYWWIPMQNWRNERDFFADGSRGQRVYVHRPTGTIIVQLAEESDQEFPFRRIVHYLNGDRYSYPLGIAGTTLRAGRISADSAGSALSSLLAAEARNPAGYTLNEAGLLSVAETLIQEHRDDAAIRVLQTAAPRYRGSCRYGETLRKHGLLSAGDSLALVHCRR